MPNEITKEVEFASLIMNKIADLIDSKSPEKIELKESELPAFFHAMTLAGAYIYEQITGDCKDFLEFNHLQNRLCFQFMQLKKEEE